jgi:23S rRNA pseudouridine1911/1915/1917 synthase
LFEDDDLIAVEKPAGLPTLPGANFLTSTLLHLLREHAPDATPLHRLGRWTSGIVLAAKSPRARADLTRQWSTNSVEKTYRALACGSPAWRETTITTPIGPVHHELLGSVHAASAAGKAARSHVVVVEQRVDAFLCDVRIATGRPHQIRIHLAAAGHPLAGDPLFGIGGLPLPGTWALPGDPGYLLHASRLAFRHPATGEAITIACEQPEQLRPERPPR